MKKTALIFVLTAALIFSACGQTAADTTGKDTENKEETTMTETETVTEAQTTAEETEAEIKKRAKFYNPVSDKSMPDPFITYYDGYYYGLATEVPSVRLYKNKTVEDLFTKGESKVVISTGADIGGGKKLGWNEWAPEIHYLPTTDRWYIYFCACTDGFDFGSMRMHCLESEGNDPFGDYTYKGTTVSNRICIDQTVYYDEESGVLYTAYCDFTELGQVIMLSDMREPWKVGSKRVMVTHPEYNWEKRGTDSSNDGRVNEGPVFIKHDGQIFLLYSASGCWSEWYCLGCLRYKGPDTSKKNFLNPDNWEKSKRPVFEKANGVYGVGHCSFFTSPDGTETWIAYHGMATPDAGVEGRYAYIQKIEFGEDGAPVLGEPLSRSTGIEVPSGQENG